MSKITAKNLERNLEVSTNPKFNADPTLDDHLSRKKYINDQDALKIDVTEKAAANGVASLDGGGKIPAAQLPNSVMEFQGNWAPSTNTPTLADGTGNAGDVYKSTDGGTVDFGAGNITFAAGDFAIYNGTIWEKSVNSNEVVSVAGKTGVVLIIAADLADFEATVSANASVAANTAKVSADGSVTSHSDVSDAGSGAIISAAERTKLSNIEVAAQVNAALASQVEAEAGIESTKTMTALRVAQAIAALETVGVTSGREVKTLVAGDITNGYIELSQPANANSLSVIPIGGIPQEPGIDFTESIVVVNTRVTFAGDLLGLVAGEKLLLEYTF